MSLAQLEQQISLATRAMEQANLNGSEMLKGDIKDELAAFQKVLENSKARLKELEAIQKQCDGLSACREADERSLKEAELSTKSVVSQKKQQPADDDSYFKPIIIPWLQKEQKDEGRQETSQDELPVEEAPREAAKEETREIEDKGLLEIVASYGSQFIGDNDTVSSLGSQIFGTSQIAKVFAREPSEMTTSSKPNFLEKFKLSTVSNQKEVVERSPSEILNAEHFAEQELKARETYIKAVKEHQAIKASGVSEESVQWKKSEKKLRDTYAQIEYWESLVNEEPTVKVPDQVSVAKPDIDIEGEEQKARDAYINSMVHHQSLVNKGVSTHSEQWIESQAKLHECLANLQHWEERRDHAVTPNL